MEHVLRAVAVYFVVWIAFRISGRRTFAEMTSFDLVLLLIISEATQGALLGDDYSVTTAGVVVFTLVLIDVALALVKQKSPRAEIVFDGLPVILVANGKTIDAHMNAERVDESDILDEARKSRGLERIDQIKYAVLERNGGISIIPMQSSE